MLAQFGSLWGCSLEVFDGKHCKHSAIIAAVWQHGQSQSFYEADHDRMALDSSGVDSADSVHSKLVGYGGL